MSGKKQVHVVKHPDGWAVKRPGTSRASVVKPTQREAIERAREIAQREGAEVLIHGRDGKIRSKDSYGRDPCPPRDKEH